MTTNEVKELIFHGKSIYETSDWGWRTFTLNGKEVTDFHYGIDYGTNGKKLPLYAIADGVVYKVSKDSVSGNYIYIDYKELGIRVFYCHLDSVAVKKGAKVTKDTKVGITGTTGSSTGIHLHLGIKYLGSNSWVNPTGVSLKPLKYGYVANIYLTNETKTTTDNLNMRKKPTTSGAKILTIPSGKEVTIVKENYKTANGYKWDKIKYSGKTGYVANTYLKAKTKKTTTKVNVRTGAGTTYNAVKTLAKNKTVTIVKENYKTANGYKWDKIDL